jgi:hypothetical protein
MRVRRAKAFLLGVGLNLITLVPLDAATISIDDILDGPPVLTAVDVPPDVPGIQNVISTPESISFTYDDLVPAASTRTRLVFLAEAGSGFASDEFSWSVVEDQSVETVSFKSDLDPADISIPNPCVFNPDFFQDSCEVRSETGDFQLVLFVPATETFYLVRSDIDLREPSTILLLGDGLFAFTLIRRRRLRRDGSAPCCAL